ncbi:hypothetical protein KZ483_15575 [Paenibacillus sp. sptzw28]|uniref:hypothetical protein n=1 Tax=Paenibacillus sp. sptzw28 TaxID=715179 RepID=UPI001C6E8BAF|nr:hypothetical protein [Paenibacillus sp. sptzw28]QYR19350.1 hypothetical protein KZ483_15575 [Paenibacillus sp. sptzw28]
MQSSSSGSAQKQNPAAPAPSPAAVSDSTAQSTTPAGSTASGSSAEIAKPAAAAGEKPLAPEKNPLGDIPDTQAFVAFTSAEGGYSLDVPEGWARTDNGADVQFVSKLDGLSVQINSPAEAPTADSIKKSLAAALVKNGRAVKINSVKEVSLPKGKAVVIAYSSNSDPDSVTGKQVRQENENYYYYNNKKLAVLTLWAPLGADNVDQWKRMSESFRWTGQ